jgi:hypothetical protein
VRFVVVAVIAFMAWPAHAHYIDASAVFADRCAERASKLDGLEAQQSFQEYCVITLTKEFLNSGPKRTKRLNDDRIGPIFLWMAPIPGDSSKHQFGTSMPQGGHPPHHSITSLAATSRIGGRSRPRAFAVLRLITSWKRVGCRTGRSAGLSPLRMRAA